MNVSREIKKVEAIKRMKAMNIYSDAIKKFKNADIVMVSEPPLGGLFWLNDEEKEMVSKFEQENNALVYLVVRSFTNLGIMDNIFYVSDYQDEWEMENEDLKDHYAFVYVVNHDMPDCSEFGSIAWKSVGGGVLRVF
ncbi:MAG: hypothetical protein SO471_07810 [Anaerobutyricum hallii]|uniref:hypothetical protein n=1 Tax=Anaerobutyricum hallii TaxID=39488 RepID=UPI002A8147E1|nr:hypothetical protein [Anaerobutyricum hallii]MDY4577854.1 hypothetical protein [Anaerobutyricum hallii]